jgi:hypothetical protein
VEELGVLIPFQCIENFCSALPLDGPFLDREVKSIHSKRAEKVLRRGEGSPFLEHVKQTNEKATVRLPLKTRGDTPNPNFAFVPAHTKASNHPSRGVSPGSGTPGIMDDLTEPDMRAQGRLVTEKPTLRDEGRDFFHKGNMVGGIPVDRN